MKTDTFYDMMQQLNPGWSKQQTLSDFAAEYETPDAWAGSGVSVAGDHEEHVEYLAGAEQWFTDVENGSPAVTVGSLVDVWMASVQQSAIGRIVRATVMVGNYGFAGKVEPDRIPAWRIDCYTERNIGTSKTPITVNGKQYYYIGTVEYPQWKEGQNKTFSKL